MDKEYDIQTHSMEYYFIIQKNEILPFATIWIDLEDNMQNEISQAEKNKYHVITFIYYFFLCVMIV